MKYLTQILKSAWLMPVVALMMLVSSCNKDLEQFPEPVPTGLKLGELLKNNPDYSFYYAMLNRGNLLSTINDSSKVYTMFVSDNAGVAKFLSAITGTPIPYPGVDDGVILGIINTQVTPEQAAGVVLYNTIPQLIKSSSISNAFPSFFYPSMINIDPRLPQDPFLFKPAFIPTQ